MRLAYSLRFRLMVFYLIVFLVLATIMMTAMPFYYEQSISRDTKALTEGTLTSIAKNIETYLDDLNRLTITPYLNEDVMQALKLKASPNYKQADSYSRLISDRALRTTLPLFMQNSRRDILATVLITEDGSAFVMSVGGGVGSPAQDYPFTHQLWYQKAVAGDGDVVFISPHPQDYLFASSERQVFSVARLIKDPDTRQPLGVIMADADTIVLARIASDIQFNVSSIICIFDAENRLLYSSRPVTADLQRALDVSSSVQVGGDSYVPVSKVITPSNWRVVVLLSEGEIAAKTRWLYLSGALFAIAGLLLTYVMFYVLSHWIIRPFEEMIGVMREVQTGNLEARYNVTGDDEIATLGGALNQMIAQLNELIDREYRAVISQRDAEHRALQSQIQPHFLYNTLNGFIGMNRLKDTEGLEKAIFALSGMLHYILEGDEWVRLEDEIKFVENYCDLQRIRFGDRLQVVITYDSVLADFQVPKLLLQPLVENAVIHGIEPLARSGTISVSARLLKEKSVAKMVVVVEDDGAGFDTTVSYARLGLSNVLERINIGWHDASLTILSQVNLGTCALIQLPLTETSPIQDI